MLNSADAFGNIVDERKICRIFRFIGLLGLVCMRGINYLTCCSSFDRLPGSEILTARRTENLQHLTSVLDDVGNRHVDIDQCVFALLAPKKQTPTRYCAECWEEQQRKKQEELYV
ncbi:hypothetical protein Trydic_g9710 [Trypoxylus dichotomus]